MPTIEFFRNQWNQWTPIVYIFSKSLTDRPPMITLDSPRDYSSRSLLSIFTTRLPVIQSSREIHDWTNSVYIGQPSMFDVFLVVTLCIPIKRRFFISRLCGVVWRMWFQIWTLKWQRGIPNALSFKWTVIFLTKTVFYAKQFYLSWTSKVRGSFLGHCSGCELLPLKSFRSGNKWTNVDL